jgi:hypothetical protein
MPLSAPTAPGIPGAAPVTALPNNGGAAPSSGPLLVTSSNSRSTYNNNVNSLNAVTTGLATTAATKAASGTPASTTSTPPGIDTNYYLKAGETIPQYNARISQYNATKTAAAPSPSNPNPAPVQTPGAPASGTGTGTGTQTPQEAGGTYTGTDGNQYYNYDGSPVPAGADTGDTATALSQNALSKGIDPSMVSAFNENYAQLSSQVNDANTTLEAAKATAANDPALASAISDIQNKFDVLIQAMQAKNAQVLGRANSSVAAFGGLGQMSQNFLNDEQSSALARIADLTNQENSLILKTQMAYQANDVKAVNAAMKDYQTALAAKQKAVLDLQTSINNAVKQQAADAKATLAAQKQELSSNISTATNVANDVATQISESGITDPATIDAFIASYADAHGITDPAILKSAVVKAQQTATKAASAAANTADTIANRDQGTKIKQQNANTSAYRAAQAGSKAPGGKGGGTDATYKYSANDLATYSDFLNKGGTLKDGTKVSPRGTDGYVDPAAYTTALNDWVKQGGTPAGFAKKFPVKTNVNPASYGELPADIQPKVTTTSTQVAPP